LAKASVTLPLDFQTVCIVGLGHNFFFGTEIGFDICISHDFGFGPSLVAIEVVFQDIKKLAKKDTNTIEFNLF
jgi:hypothetical protein